MTPLQAHLKLLSILPVRTHEIGDKQKKLRWSRNPKPVVIKGKEYDSISNAAKKLRTSRGTVHYWVKTRSDCYYA